MQLKITFLLRIFDPIKATTSQQLGKIQNMQ